MIYSDPSGFEALSPAQQQEAMAAYIAHNQALWKAGVLRGANRLRPTHAATTVRVQSRKTAVLRGPYADTAMLVGLGFLVLQIN